MRSYVLFTGLVFVLLTVAHVLRAFQEPHLVRDPWFIGTSVLALGFAAWALRLYTRRTA